MTALAIAGLFADCAARDVRLSAKGDQLAVDAPAGSVEGDLLASLREHRAALLRLLRVPQPAQACRVCGGTHSWQSVHGVWTCERCHPPASGVAVRAASIPTPP